MSTIFSDFREKLTDRHSLSQFLYADDTLTFVDHTQSIHKLLKEIGMESSYYSLKLHKNKCVNLTTNRQTSTIKYRDGSKVPRSHRAVYLGTLLTDTVDNSAEIHNRMARPWSHSRNSNSLGTKPTPPLHGNYVYTMPLSIRNFITA